MTVYGTFQILAFVALALISARPLGGYIERVFKGERTHLYPVLGWLERSILRSCRINPLAEQSWQAYTLAMLVFSFVGVAVLFVLQLLQGVLPLNPEHLKSVTPDLALNTAVSFVTNTNWQSYAPESTVSYLVQMAGLTVQNFVSSAVGISIAIALIRGLARSSSATIGNFWADIVRVILYLLLPVSFLFSIALVAQGVPQNFNAYQTARALDGGIQVIAQGPVASQESIKMFGTNGGGFFNANSAHPYENPTPLTNMFQMLSIFAIGAALTNTFGRMVRDERQGWAILATMGILFLAGVTTMYWAEGAGTPVYQTSGVSTIPTVDQPGGNMEGKEVRFGIAATALFSTLTTDAACGAVNGMHSSLTPLGGLVAIFNMHLGEVVVGGVGAGLYGILLYAILAVFIAGLMVGRTPEFVGKKVESREIKMTVLALVLILPLSILGFTALASVTQSGLAGPLNDGPHGFTEILYAYSSATGNNGSAFAGISANSVFYNITLAIAMIIGRLLFIVPVMAIAGSMAAKEIHPPSTGTFPTTGSLWVALLAGVILVVGGLTFFSTLVLGPIAEHLTMSSGAF